MSEPHFVSALKAKRAEIAGEVIIAEKRFRHPRADLESLDGAIRVFDPEAAPHRLKAKLPRGAVPVLPAGRGTRIIMDTLRRAEKPLSAREIAERIAAEYRLDTAPLPMKKLTGKVRNALRYQEAGTIAKEMDGDTILWRLA